MDSGAKRRGARRTWNLTLVDRKLKDLGLFRIRAETSSSWLQTNSNMTTARKAVSKAEFDAKLAVVFDNTTGCVETPADDVQIMANLLGVQPGILGGTRLQFPNGGEACGHCGRAFSFLDIVETGLQAHSKEFLVDVMTGKHGYIFPTYCGVFQLSATYIVKIIRVFKLGIWRCGHTQMFQDLKAVGITA
ncbi:hypothetical protein C8J57DRAFT_1223082 [Mycena rebaudengoi]|nr:hypothetical protein C8J57DRAFT_1223082 [Mycena rebaudengoi]